MEQLQFNFEPAAVWAKHEAAAWNKPLKDALIRAEEDLHPPVEGREMTLEEELGW